eukprot:7382687-Prymnesium_polylepis.1
MTASAYSGASPPRTGSSRTAASAAGIDVPIDAAHAAHRSDQSNRRVRCYQPTRCCTSLDHTALPSPLAYSCPASCGEHSSSRAHTCSSDAAGDKPPRRCCRDRGSVAS